MAAAKQRPKKRSRRRADLLPPPPDRGIACEGFHVAVDPELSPRAAALAVKSAIANVLKSPDAWRVVRLSREQGEFTATRVHGRRPISGRRAFELGHELARRPGIVAVEPALIVPSSVRPGPTPGVSFKPPPMRVAQATSAKVATAALLPALADDCEWSIKQIRARDAWELSAPEGAKGVGIVIGHPDTGYTHHPEIREEDGGNRVQFECGYDFVASDADPLDELEGSAVTLQFPGHGTATASVLMSDVGGPNQRFVTGVAPRASLVPFRVSTSVIHLSFKNLTAAIYAAMDAGCHVISMSLGGPVPSDALERAIQYAIRRGTIVLAAAGNYWPWVAWPAAYGEVIAVAACNAEEQIWKWSATGAAVDVTGPGEDVWVARSTRAASGGSGRYDVDQSSGTSFAVAHVAGAAALWLAHHGRDALIARYGAENLSSVFRSTLRATVRTPSGWDGTAWGAGILDAEALLAADVLAAGRTFATVAKTASVRARPADAGEAFRTKLGVYFPDATDDALRDLTARLLGGRDVDLDESIRRFGHELLVHVGTDASFRKKVGQMLGAKGAKTMGMRRGTRYSGTAIPAAASSGLRSHILAATAARLTGGSA